MTTVQRRQKGHQEKVNVPCPTMIRAYNNGMNGTDVMDNARSHIRSTDARLQNITLALSSTT